jgi:hypothetical protein
MLRCCVWLYFLGVARLGFLSRFRYIPIALSSALVTSFGCVVYAGVDVWIALSSVLCRLLTIVIYRALNVSQLLLML